MRLTRVRVEVLSGRGPAGVKKALLILPASQGNTVPQRLKKTPDGWEQSVFSSEHIHLNPKISHKERVTGCVSKPDSPW